MKFFLSAFFFILTSSFCLASPPLLQNGFSTPDTYLLEGNAKLIDLDKTLQETGGACIALNSARNPEDDLENNGRVEVDVKGLKTEVGQWYRFSFSGLPQERFSVAGPGDLLMQVKFFGQDGKESLDGVIKEIYEDVQKDQDDLKKNGNGFKDGGQIWRRYAFDFKLPFGTIDALKLIVKFQNGTGRISDASFLVDDFTLERISVPATSTAKTAPVNFSLAGGKLLPLGGKWFYFTLDSESTSKAPKKYDSENLDRLVYKTGETLETPFALNRGTWLRKGFMDQKGDVAGEDKWIENPVTIEFSKDSLTMSTSNLPNHPTGLFPGYLRNPNYIQEKRLSFTLPFDPEPNPKAEYMKNKNANNALPKGPVGIAVNGVIFYNPYDAGSEEAVGMMDRCCGHPDPGNFYHYHKYPVCARSPFEDSGKTHSPLIGWAFDGFPVYGPYEGNGEMAMDSKLNPLNEFNVHKDEERGWHYHVSPGKFPYLLGGYWGTASPANMQMGRGRPGEGGDMRGGRQGPPGNRQGPPSGEGGEDRPPPPPF